MEEKENQSESNNQNQEDENQEEIANAQLMEQKLQEQKLQQKEQQQQQPNQSIPQQKYDKTETHTHVYKIVLVGDAGVGKTHIINRYVKGQLPHAIIPTIGIEFATKTVTLRDGGTIKAQIWDTAGQEKYRSITSAHYRKAVGALLVYDISKKKSFESIKKWVEEIKLHADKDIVLMIVGNKLDLVNSNPQFRQVQRNEAEEFAYKNNMLFQEGSAMMDVNITDTFETMLEEIYDQKCRVLTEKSVINTEAEENQQIIDLTTLKQKNTSASKDFCSCS